MAFKGADNGKAGDQDEVAAENAQRSERWTDWFRQQPNDLERCNGEKDLQACRCQSRSEEMNDPLELFSICGASSISSGAGV